MSEAFWAITCYFNPMRCRRRLENYRAFRQHLTVPLAAVELSYDRDFELSAADADKLIQLRGTDVLWQKERLLNLASEALPQECTNVAWLDCDIVFADEDWAEQTCEALERTVLVQPYKYLSESSLELGLDQALTGGPWLSSGYVLATDASRLRQQRIGRVGYAWATHRHVLDRHGLYDACVVGGGDRAIVYAALGWNDTVRVELRMNLQREQHYLAWAKPFYHTVQGKVGYLDGRLTHLWHGNFGDRDYRGRHTRFARFELDPFTDIALEESGCLRWNSDKPEMHEFVRRYFDSRNEGISTTDFEPH